VISRGTFAGLEAKHKTGYDSGTRVRNMELVVPGDEVGVQVICLGAQPEMITQAEVQAAAKGPGEGCALFEKVEAIALQMVVDVSTSDQELPEGPDPGRSWQRN
jgi:hypothetical protein